MTDFTDEQIERYSRHIMLPEVGGVGQKKLLDAKVLLIGAGGLGSPAAYYLAAAGVGNLGIVDFDTVDLSNLQRQIIHSTERIGMLKTESAKKTIQALNPDVNVTLFNERLSSENIKGLFENYDYILDGTDNFATRYLINDACVMMGKTNIHGSIFRFEGQATVFKPGEGPCYRCLYPEPPPPGLVPQLPGRRRARCAGRSHRQLSGRRNRQTDPRHRQFANRIAFDLRRAEHGIPQAQAQTRCQLPCLQ